MKKGILTHPKRENDTTVFKLCVWYDKKTNGEYFTQWEKDVNKNRKYHDSIDFILTSGGYITRHDEALNKLLNHITKWEGHIIRALLYYNDFAHEKQYLIGKFDRDKTKNVFIQPLFEHKQKVFYTEKVFYNLKTDEPPAIKEQKIETNNVFCVGLLAKPLNEYSLKHNKTVDFYKQNLSNKTK
jgi:hypothetical protein